jgi:superfamily II DNA helicase RecQ
MQFRTFHIPLQAPDDGLEEMNRFLRGHRILSVDKRFCEKDPSGWAFCVEYFVSGSLEPERQPRPKVDYKEVLNEEQFKLFCRLRDLRKRFAEDEGVPVYTVFTNEQLAGMVQSGVQSLSEMGQIPGVGKARIDKYAKSFLGILQGDDGQ